jgi:5-methylcytosine-specific restriction endonuclease McrA
MRFLKKPQIDVAPEVIFKDCVDGFIGKSKAEKLAYEKLRNGLHKCDDLVRIDSENYQQKIRSGSYQTSELPKDVSPDDVANVYSKIFTKKKPGRTYYEIIKGGTYCDRCPICGSRGSKTHLDHYLPKSEFPTLCITPENLVPICSTCNEKKGTYYSLDKETRPFHLYFDKDSLPLVEGKYNEAYQEIYLKAVITQKYRIVFQTVHPIDRSTELQKRLDKHVETYGLLERYEACVEPAIAQLWCDWQDKILDIVDSDPTFTRTSQMESDILQDLISERVRSLRRTPNTWESALFRAMQAQQELIYLWFKDHEDKIKKSVQKHCRTNPEDE